MVVQRRPDAALRLLPGLRHRPHRHRAVMGGGGGADGRATAARCGVTAPPWAATPPRWACNASPMRVRHLPDPMVTPARWAARAPRWSRRAFTTGVRVLPDLLSGGLDPLIAGSRSAWRRTTRLRHRPCERERAQRRCSPRRSPVAVRVARD